jgi:hypothetical protein
LKGIDEHNKCDSGIKPSSGYKETTHLNAIAVISSLKMIVDIAALIVGITYFYKLCKLAKSAEM